MFGNLESRLGNRSDILQYFMSDLKKYAAKRKKADTVIFKRMSERDPQ